MCWEDVKINRRKYKKSATTYSQTMGATPVYEASPYRDRFIITTSTPMNEGFATDQNYAIIGINTGGVISDNTFLGYWNSNVPVEITIENFGMDLQGRIIFNPFSALGDYTFTITDIWINDPEGNGEPK